MTKEQFAKLLDGREYHAEITKEECIIVRDSGLVVVFGYSDDNTEFRGAIDEEVGSWDGTTIYLDAKGIFEECDCDCIHYKRAKYDSKTIRAIWCPPSGGSWAYATDIPHETFKIYEDGELYCEGIVFAMEDLT